MSTKYTDSFTEEDIAVHTFIITHPFDPIVIAYTDSIAHETSDKFFELILKRRLIQKMTGG